MADGPKIPKQHLPDPDCYINNPNMSRAHLLISGKLAPQSQNWPLETRDAISSLLPRIMMTRMKDGGKGKLVNLVVLLSVGTRSSVMMMST